MLRGLIAAAGVLLLVPAAAHAQSESVTSGDVTATLTWTPGADAGVTGGRLAITRGGVVAFDAAIPRVVCDGCTLPGNGADDVKLVDLDGDGRPEIATQDWRLEPLMSPATASMTPPRVLIFTRQDDVPLLAEVTTKYLDLVRPHAARVKRALARARTVRDRSGLLTAYVADQYLLGRGSTGLKELDRQIRAGRLGSPTTAKRIRRHLLDTLKADGYR